jgi:hypothetical protein
MWILLFITRSACMSFERVCTGTTPLPEGAWLPATIRYAHWMLGRPSTLLWLRTDSCLVIGDVISWLQWIAIEKDLSRWSLLLSIAKFIRHCWGDSPDKTLLPLWSWFASLSSEKPIECCGDSLMIRPLSCIHFACKSWPNHNSLLLVT